MTGLVLLFLWRISALIPQTVSIVFSSRTSSGMLAAIQAPIIMMSQNREAKKDRISIAHDYEVNLKSEPEIRQLHEKVDDLSQIQLKEFFNNQSRILINIEKHLSNISAFQ